jgi:hypothetical protein
MAAALASLSIVCVDARGHIALDQPPKRDAAMKTHPCGGTGARSATPAVFAPGQKITVQWHETVVHPGFFRIALSMDGTTFPTDPTDPPPAVAAPVLAIIPKVDGITSHSSDITLPETPCETCTIQVIQYMRAHPPPYYYYQCADIAIRTGGSGGAGGATSTGGGPGGGAGGVGGLANGAGGGVPDGVSGNGPGNGAGGTSSTAGVTGSGGFAGSTPDAGTSAASTDSGGCALTSRGSRRSPTLLLAALAAAAIVGSLRRRRW